MKAYQIKHDSYAAGGADPAWWQFRASVHANRASNPIPFEDASEDQHKATKAAGIARSLMGLVESDYDGDGSCDYVDRDTLYIQVACRAYRWASNGDARPRLGHHATPLRGYQIDMVESLNSMYPERIKTWNIDIEPPRVVDVKHRIGLSVQRIGRGLRRHEHYHTGWSDDMTLHYRVWQERDGKFVTHVYQEGFFCASYRSKRVKLAIGKGKRWINRQPINGFIAL